MRSPEIYCAVRLVPGQSGATGAEVLGGDDGPCVCGDASAMQRVCREFQAHLYSVSRRGRKLRLEIANEHAEAEDGIGAPGVVKASAALQVEFQRLRGGR